MCARYLFELKLNQWSEGLAQVFESFADWSRWNIAPTAEVPVVRAGPPGGGPRADALRWGLIPSWSKDASFGARAINARSETVAEKPAFRSAFKRRRCLVPASGFYEWSGPKGARTAHLFALRDGQPFTFAGPATHDSSPMFRARASRMAIRLRTRSPTRGRRTECLIRSPLLPRLQ
jgi:putative SOS response-associated peptidase YedK